MLEQWKDISIVIAVMKKEIAKEIQAELMSRGIDKERLIWIPVYHYANPRGIWKTEKIG